MSLLSDSEYVRLDCFILRTGSECSSTPQLSVVRSLRLNYLRDVDDPYGVCLIFPSPFYQLNLYVVAAAHLSLTGCLPISLPRIGYSTMKPQDSLLPNVVVLDSPM